MRKNCPTASPFPAQKCVLGAITLTFLLPLLSGCMEGQKSAPLMRAGRVAPVAVAVVPPPPEVVPPPPPPPKVDPPESEPKKPLLDRIGGKDAVTKVVDDFVTNVAADENIKDDYKKPFKEGEVDELKKKLVSQMVEATGNPEKYTSKSLKESLVGLKITDKDFDAFMDDLSKALDANKIAKSDKDELMNMLEKMRKDVVEPKDEK